MLDNKVADAEVELEADVEEYASNRLQQPLSINEIMTKCAEFNVATDERMDREEDTDMYSVYSYEDLEPYILSKNLEVDSEEDGDGDNPILPFSSYQRKMECVTDDGKIKKKLERCGAGPVVGDKECVVYVHYSMYNDHEQEPFDASRLRQKKPCQFRLGHDMMIEGMMIAIQTMRKGEKSKFVIESKYAFKEAGVPPRIPPNATILVDIELIDFVDNERAVAQNGNEDEIQKPKTFQEILSNAQYLRQRGNSLKKIQKDVNGAIRDYRKAIYILVQFHHTNDEDKLVGRKEMLGLYQNLCVCLASKGAYKQTSIAYENAVEDCQELAEKCPKLLYQSAKALRNLGDSEEAVVRLKRALEMKPDDGDILRELEIATRKKAETERKERNLYQHMLGLSKNKTENKDKFEKMLENISDDFKDLVVTQIDTMMGSDQDMIRISFGATPAEKEYCQKLCQKNDLSFRVLIMDGTETFIITKKL